MKNPLIVGYRGEIGSYLLAGLIKYMPSATNILCFDQAEDEYERKDRIDRADVIYLCIPLHETVYFFKDYHTLLQGKTVVEQSSLKGIVYQNSNFKSYTKGINVLSMHILFRPSATPNKEDQSICIISEGQEQLDRWNQTGIISFIRDGLKVEFFMIPTWKKHDQEMALQQALVHRILLTLSETISEGDIGWVPRYKTNTYIGKQVNRLALRIKQGDYDLYSLIQANPQLGRKLREFNTRLDKFDLAKQMKKVCDEKCK